MSYTEYVQRKDWGPGNLLQQWVSSRVLKNFLKITGQRFEEINLLEVGTGIGTLAKVAISRGVKHYTGVEPNSELAKATRSLVEDIVIHENYLPNLPSSLNTSFNAVIAVHVIEHATSGYEAREWIEALSKTVQTGGHMLIVSPESLDFKTYFWDIDWSHGFPTSVNNLKQIMSDLNLELVCAKKMRLGSINPIISSLGWLLNLLLPTRLLNLLGQICIGRDLGTGIKASLFWGVTFVVITQTDK